MVLAAIALEHGNDAKAKELSDLAAKIGGAVGWRHILLGRLALKRSDTAAARAAARAAAKADVAWPELAGDLGVLLSRTGLHAEALPFLARATEARRYDPQAAYNYGIALQFTGDLRKAREVFEDLVTREPGHAQAWLALVPLAKDRHEEFLPMLEQRFAATDSVEDRLMLGHAIARMLEDKGEWDASLGWLDRAKEPLATRIGHDRAATERLFAASAASAESPIPALSGDTSPLFIVGMPRSGTTLAERILSAHPDVTSAGELSDFAVLAKRTVQTPGGHVLDAPTIEAAASADLSAIEGAYVERVRTIVGDSPHFIDKMPFNFFFAPLILQALPGARVICLRRSPQDTVFSNYRQLFATAFTYYSYAYHFEDTAHFVAQFEKLIDHFEQALPENRFLSLSYEEIVADFDRQARKLVAFAGLDWDDACAAFHENTAPVATASSLQVRQPIYANAVARWKRYPGGAIRVQEALSRLGIGNIEKNIG
ncbi:tetratricopeptide repeat-containing sulfotransferase family protein [Croceicoccus gelatinilyticus]|uniref:tetratricopeptide repeat-containing sulfotransferase family protein n=1 Tax=Croceicoccus gelatinilyticus TaxID=2835536 RepID=UPI001BD0F420|nr:sulfotransferase [Croceicoccus gelatinilyticus]MBS7669563.1 sulfotransferase [Croceicoccus gelatinilyticus]